MNKQYDRSMMGDEPKFNGTVRSIDLIKALNWYNYYYTVKDSRKWIVDYMKFAKYSNYQIECYNRSPDVETTQTMCSLARLITNGAKIDNPLDEKLTAIIAKYKVVNNVVSFDSNPIIEAIDQQVDQLVSNKYCGQLVQINVAQYSKRTVSKAKHYYQQLLDELKLIGVDSQVTEAYRSLSKRQRTNYIEFVQSIVDMLSGVARVRTVVRKQRAKKQKPASKVVSKLNYLVQDKKLNVQSVNPQSIVDCSVLWTFNTKSRKLTKYQAKPGTKLTVKGTTIINYDPDKSFTKTIRKPQIIVPYIATNASKAVDATVAKVKAKQSAVRARTNDLTILVRTFK